MDRQCRRCGLRTGDGVSHRTSVRLESRFTRLAVPGGLRLWQLRTVIWIQHCTRHVDKPLGRAAGDKGNGHDRGRSVCEPDMQSGSGGGPEVKRKSGGGRRLKRKTGGAPGVRSRTGGEAGCNEASMTEGNLLALRKLGSRARKSTERETLE